MANWKDSLDKLPPEWALTPVRDKKPLRPEWNTETITRDELALLLRQGQKLKKQDDTFWHCRWNGVGLRTGEISGGIVAVDVDGESAQAQLEKLGQVPETIAFTSGKPHRKQLLFHIPEAFRRCPLRDRRVIQCDAGEQLEIRWNNHQSVIPPSSHPETKGYTWIHSPGELEIAQAPQWVIDYLARTDQFDEEGNGQPYQVGIHDDVVGDRTQNSDRTIGDREKWTDQDWALSYLAALAPWRADDYDCWLKIGMALHSVGDSLLQEWETWSKVSSKYKEGTCNRKWNTFKKQGTSIATLAAFAKEDGWTNPWKKEPIPVTKPIKKIITKPEPEPEPEPKIDTGNLSDRHRKKVELLSDIKYLLGPRLRLNTMRGQVELDDKPIEDLEFYYLKLVMEHGIFGGKQMVVDWMIYLAQTRKYNPVEEYLNRVYEQHKDSAMEEFKTIASRYMGVERPIYNTFIFKTMLAAVARTFEPGCKVDTVLVLQGPQRVFKSTFFKTLALGKWFDDSFDSRNGVDEKMKLRSSWIIEWAEIETVFKKKDISQTKAFLSSATDLLRVPYGRAIEEFKRHSIIVASTNEDEFLSDPTGDRRFWVIPVAQRMDTDALALEVDQLWAAAVHVFKTEYLEQGFKKLWCLTEEEELECAELNNNFRASHPWQTPIKAWLREQLPGEDITIPNILTNCLKIEVGRQTKRDQMTVANQLKALGWTKQRTAKSNYWIEIKPIDVQGVQGTHKEDSLRLSECTPDVHLSSRCTSNDHVHLCSPPSEVLTSATPTGEGVRTACTPCTPKQQTLTGLDSDDPFAPLDDPYIKPGISTTPKNQTLEPGDVVEIQEGQFYGKQVKVYRNNPDFSIEVKGDRWQITRSFPRNQLKFLRHADPVPTHG